MPHKKNLLGAIALSGLALGFPASHFASAADAPAATQPTGAAHRATSGGEDKDEAHEHEGREARGEDRGERDERGEHREREEKDEHREDKDRDEKDWKHDKGSVEQAVQLNMVPQAILDVVKKEVPDGTIGEAELEVKKGKIVYGFDVKAGDVTYDINVSVDGKFISKTVDDEADEDDDKSDGGEKK